MTNDEIYEIARSKYPDGSDYAEIYLAERVAYSEGYKAAQQQCNSSRLFRPDESPSIETTEYVEREKYESRLGSAKMIITEIEEERKELKQEIQRLKELLKKMVQDDCYDSIIINGGGQTNDEIYREMDIAWQQFKQTNNI